LAITYHLTTTDQWDRQSGNEEYVPDAFAGEGFIHCTDGVQNLIDVGNRYYTGDLRTFVCLEIDLDLVKSPVRYEDVANIYPHIYGPLQTKSVVAVRSVKRTSDGEFVAID
jgi:uncharacterized protein (DUF952 family)